MIKVLLLVLEIGFFISSLHLFSSRRGNIAIIIASVSAFIHLVFIFYIFALLKHIKKVNEEAAIQLATQQPSFQFPEPPPKYQPSSEYI